MPLQAAPEPRDVIKGLYSEASFTCITELACLYKRVLLYAFLEKTIRQSCGTLDSGTQTCHLVLHRSARSRTGVGRDRREFLREPLWSQETCIPSLTITCLDLY